MLINLGAWISVAIYGTAPFGVRVSLLVFLGAIICLRSMKTHRRTRAHPKVACYPAAGGAGQVTRAIAARLDDLL